MEIQALQKEGVNQLKQAQIPDARRKINRVLTYLTGKNAAQLMVYEKEMVTKKQEEEFFSLVKRVVNGEPIQYITHQQEFMGLSFYVTEDVLIPQPDTETLVEESMKRLPENATILDLCTGSGCVGISIAHHMKSLQKVILADISTKALEIAKKNAKDNDVTDKIELLQTDLWEKIEGKFDAIVSNPPYIPTAIIPTLSSEVQKEPKLALDGGEDGLIFYRKIISQADQYLVSGGYLLCEIGFDQALAVKTIWEESRSMLQWEGIRKDLAGLDRVAILRRK